MPAEAAATRGEPSAAAASAAWARLSAGEYLAWCPPEHADELSAALRLCLNSTAPLTKVHLLRLRDAKESGDAARSKLILLTPNYKDQLRSRVLASGPSYDALVASYRRLVHGQVLPRLACALGERGFAVQRLPSLRFNLPGSSALGARGEDGDTPGDTDACIGLHRDMEYGHQPGEMNFMLALTPVSGSNGLYVESAPGAADYRAVEMGAGGIFSFHGAGNRHHNQRNTTGASRVSMDFRIIPLSRYDHGRDEPAHAPADKRELRFVIGQYFERVELEPGGVGEELGSVG